MNFRGLFIGIDRYVSSGIYELSCARHDARALEALFADTFGDTTTLLVDENATYDRIASEFAALESCQEDDTVVISFSGHGSETHQLVAHDTDVDDLERTSISLDQIEGWFSRIPAKRLVLILDCCFSGGVGAKVLQVVARPRDMSSTEASLAKLAGDGRIIFTASGATEAAWEHGRFRHGLLTYFLLEALRGPDEVLDAGRIPFYRVLDYVTARVKSAANQFGEVQNPTMRGQIDGELIWPVFVAGRRYFTEFPEQASAVATEALGSLAALGFPAELITTWAQSIPSLNALQVEAINDYGLLNGNHLVVSAPTSSGKTMVGELAALYQVLNRKRAIFLFPLKALVADKRRHFEAVYGPFGIRTIEATGETDDISPLIRGQYDIALLTYEKFAALALTFPHMLAQTGVVVVDEAQMIADKSRGANLEFILTLIRMRRREDIEPQIVLLSAVIGDTGGLESWLGGRLLRRTQRPVPLAEGILRADGSFRYLDPDTGEEKIEAGVVQRQYGKGSSQDWIIPLVRKLTAASQQIIIFRETKMEARYVANYLAENLGMPPAIRAVSRMPITDPSQANSDLVADLKRGVAFHNADLQPLERRVVEEEFRRAGSGLRVISATTTLAMGINTPASTVVIAGLDHPGDVPYSVAEYKNLIGRAGRLGYSEKGTSYLLALDARVEHDYWSRYVLGTPEDLQSRFLDAGTDPRSLIVRVLVSARRSFADGVAADEIFSFLEASFGVFQAARMEEGWQWSRTDLFNALSDLEQHQLLQRNTNSRYELTTLGRLAGESATEVESIIRLVAILSNLNPDDITDPAIITAVQASVELDKVLIPFNKKSTDKEPRFWPNELRIQGVSPNILRMLGTFATDAHVSTTRSKKAVACLLFISGEPMSRIESTIVQFGGTFGGAAGPVRSVATRTSDLLPIGARVAEILYPTIDLGQRITRLVVRLTYGVPGSVAELARETGSNLLRGDYCALAATNLGDAAEIVASGDTALLAALAGDQDKLNIVRAAANKIAVRRAKETKIASPILPPYVA